LIYSYAFFHERNIVIFIFQDVFNTIFPENGVFFFVTGDLIGNRPEHTIAVIRHFPNFKPVLI